MASKYSTERFARKIKFDDSRDYYELQLRPRRNYWWLLLLLLPLLLLIRCERDITVVCVDDDGAPIEGALTSLCYDARWLWNDGLLPVETQYGEKTTDAEGKATYTDLPCSVFSYIFAPLTRVTATGECYPYTTESATALFHFTREITLTLHADTAARDVDIVMVIDNTGSMDEVHDAIKSKALTIYDALMARCRAIDKPLRKVRMKIISYGDFEDSRISQSELYDLPARRRDMGKFIDGLTLTHGGDEPENSLEALSVALDTPWTKSGTERRHVVVLITDAETHPLGVRAGEANYPAGMPADMNALRAKWDNLDPASRRLILFAPDHESWSEVASWPQTEVISRPVYSVISTDGLDAVINIISESL